MGFPSVGVPYIQARKLEPAIRIERTTCGLRMEEVEIIKGSVFQMVSPFYIEIPRLKNIPAALLISEVLMDSNNF